MTEKRFALRAAAGFAGFVMAASLAGAPAFAEEKDRGNSEEARQSAPGQQKQEEAPGNGNPPSHAGGQDAQSPPPGHARPQGEPARPTHTSRPAKPARPAKPQHAARPARPAHPVHPAKPARPAKPQHATRPAKPANPHAKAGKTTICHATGSATNPYVTITISNNALPAHARHQDGRDLIPAPAGGCPTTTAPAGSVKAEGAPAAAGGKAAPASAPAQEKGGVLGFFGRGGSAAEAPIGGVLGEIAEGGAAPSSLPQLRPSIAAAAVKVTRRESGAQAPAKATGQLPFTGLEAALVALLGVLLVLMGVLFRQLGGGPRTA